MFIHRTVGAQHAGTLFLDFNRCFSQTSALNGSKNVPGVYVASIEGKQNSSPILLGLTDYFERHMSSVGFFQPVCIPSFTAIDTNLHSDSYCDSQVSGEPFPNSATGLSRHIDL